ncbi:MAG TPA: MFS transporter [Bryobacteraceae bacterium]|nr:MFS transporter [Bryobacteraceae bacterium]
MTPSPRRWFAISLVFAATVINYLDRQTLSVLAPVLREEFGLTNVDYSRIVSAFMVAYTVMNGLSGPLIDRIGTRAGYALCVAWWSAASISQAFATNGWTLGATRFLLGMGEAGNWPAGIRVVAEWFPPQERPLASGIFNSGSSVGALVAAPLVVFLSLRFGWRAAFVAVGMLGFIWLAVWWFSYRPPEVSAAGPAIPVPVRTLLGLRFIRGFFLVKLLFDPVWYFYIFWFPEYLKNGRHLDMAQIGMFGWIPFLAADLGNLAGGWFCGFLLGKGISPDKAKKGTVALAAFCMTAAVPAVFAGSVWTSMACISLAMAGYTGANAVLLSIPSDVLPPGALASSWGLCSMGSGFGGMVFALATGWLVDNYSYVPAFLLFGTLPLVAAAALWTCVGRLERR